MFKRMRLPQLTAALIAAAVCVQSAPAGEVENVTTAGSTIDTITALRAGLLHNYATGDLTNVTLTDIDGVSNDADRARIFVPSGSGVPADRSSVIEDLDLDTGLNNPESITLDFNAPLINSGGIDLVLFDWGTDDPLQVTINGVTRSYTTSDYDSGPSNGFNTSILRSSSAVNSVAELESDSYAGFSGSMATLTTLGIDLSDYGVALDATAVTVRVDDNTGGSSQMDPMAVVGFSRVGGLVDDFEQDYAGTNNIDGQSGWTVTTEAPTEQDQVTVFDPTGGTAFDDNRVLRVFDSVHNIYHQASIRDGDSGFLQFDVYNPDDNGGGAGSNTPDLNIGLTTEAVPNEASDMAAMVRVVGDDLQVYDGGFKTVLAGSFVQDQWYTIRIEIDNLLDTYQVLVKGGAFSEFTLVDSSGDDTFDFRSGAGANDLVNFYTRTNGGHNDDIVYLDNISVIIPAPAALPAGLAMLGALTMRRRRTQ